VDFKIYVSKKSPQKIEDLREKKDLKNHQDADSRQINTV